MKPNHVVIGLDIGTTTTKALAFSGDGQVIASDSQPNELLYPSKTDVVQQPEHILRTTTEALAGCVRRVHDAGYEVGVVGLSAAMHSLAAFDHDGRVVLPALTWMDTRAAAVAAALRATAQGRSIYERTGTPLHAMSPLIKLRWLASATPDIVRRAARFASLKEYLWYTWLGEWVADESIASATGLYNLRSRAWDEHALQYAGVSAEQLSQLAPTTYHKPTPVSSELTHIGIPAGTPIVIGASDGVLANVGMGVLSHHEQALTIGTSIAVRAIIDEPHVDTQGGTFCYVLTPDRFVIGGPSNSGGIVLEWLVREVGDCSDAETGFEQLFGTASSIGPSADGILCLPYLTGERAPIWDEDAMATFYGLRLHHTRSHLLRAGLEAVVYSAHWVAEKVTQYTGQPERLIGSGGVLEHPVMRQVVADVFGVPLYYRPQVDASALGAAALALYAVGEWENLDQVKTWMPAPSVQEPDRSLTPVYQAAFIRFKALYHRLQGFTPSADGAPTMTS